jgi:hypothetical protein
MFGGLAEYSSMLVGFQYLLFVAAAFYALSAVGRWWSATRLEMEERLVVVATQSK